MPDQRTTRLQFNGAAGGTVEIDGTDISHTVQDVTLTARPGQLPTLRLDLVVYTAEVDGEAVVSVPEETAAALVALGWTPPSEGDPRCTCKLPIGTEYGHTYACPASADELV